LGVSDPPGHEVGHIQQYFVIKWKWYIGSGSFDKDSCCIVSSLSAHTYDYRELLMTSLLRRGKKFIDGYVQFASTNNRYIAVTL